MGYLTEDGRWIPGHGKDQERAGRASEVRRIAREALTSQPGPRPIEEATRGDSDPTRKAARQFVALVKGGANPGQIAAALALERQDRPDADESDANLAAVDEIARGVDDDVQAGHDAEEAEDVEDQVAWLEETHGLTVEQLGVALEQLPGGRTGAHAVAMLQGLADEYLQAVEGEADEDDEGGYADAEADPADEQGGTGWPDTGDVAAEAAWE